MLTEYQFYINEEVRKSIEDDMDAYLDNLQLEPGDTPFFDFAYYELDNYPRLLIMLNLSEKKEEFVCNSFYFLMEQERYYKQKGIQPSIAVEHAFNDLKNVYIIYNQLPIKI